jgi:hypothetical protein
MARIASFDTDLEQWIGEIMGLEARAVMPVAVSCGNAPVMPC